MRIVFFSDSHLGFDQPVRSNSIRNCRGPDFFANFQCVLDYARKTRPEFVIHGGDFFFRSKVHPSIVNHAYQSLFEFAECGIPILIVPGNHERSVMPSSLFLNHPNIHIFHCPQTKVFKLADTRLNVTGFPYVPQIRQRFADIIRQACDGRHDADVSLLCFHHAVDGATVGPGHFTFRDRADTISAATLPEDFDLILSGHIHKHQWLALPTPVLYCGSIERTSFAEAGEQKGFCEIEFRDASPAVRFHPLPTRKMITFDGLSYLQQEDFICALIAASSDWPSDAIVKLRLNAYPTGGLRQFIRSRLPGLVQLSVARSRSASGS